MTAQHDKAGGECSGSAHALRAVVCSSACCNMFQESPCGWLSRRNPNMIKLQNDKAVGGAMVLLCEMEG